MASLGSTTGDSLAHSDGTEVAGGAEKEQQSASAEANGEDDNDDKSYCKVCGHDYVERGEFESDSVCSNRCSGEAKMKEAGSPLVLRSKCVKRGGRVLKRGAMTE